MSVYLAKVLSLICIACLMLVNGSALTIESGYFRKVNILADTIGTSQLFTIAKYV